MQRVSESVVDGFIVWTASDDDPVVDAVAASGLPAVVHAGPPRPGLPAVGIDDRAAAAPGRGPPEDLRVAVCPVNATALGEARIAFGRGLPGDLDPAGWEVIQRTSTRPSS